MNQAEAREVTIRHARFMTKAEIAECFHRDEATISDDEYRQMRLDTIAYLERRA